MQVATTNVIKEYFPGRQVGPFGALCFTVNMAAMLLPQMWNLFISSLGWQNTLISIGKHLRAVTVDVIKAAHVL